MLPDYHPMWRQQAQTSNGLKRLLSKVGGIGGIKKKHIRLGLRWQPAQGLR
jgi:hypothetical protein